MPGFGRQAFHHNLFQKAPRIVTDDVWTFNSQSSTQWDGLRHFAYQKEAKFYNDLALEDFVGCPSNNVNGIQAWADKGIVGRGILLDFHSWRLKNGVDYNPFETGHITLEQLKAVADAQGTDIRHGDILIIRSGYIAAFNALSAAARKDYAKVVPPPLSGVEQSKEVLEWFWDNFAAVAGDQPSFECWRR